MTIDEFECWILKLDWQKTNANDNLTKLNFRFERSKLLRTKLNWKLMKLNDEVTKMGGKTYNSILHCCLKHVAYWINDDPAVRDTKYRQSNTKKPHFAEMNNKVKNVLINKQRKRNKEASHYHHEYASGVRKYASGTTRIYSIIAMVDVTVIKSISFYKINAKIPSYWICLTAWKHTFGDRFTRIINHGPIQAHQLNYVKYDFLSVWIKRTSYKKFA